MPLLSRADWHVFSLALGVTCGVELTLSIAFPMLLRLAPDSPFMVWSYEVQSPGFIYLPIAVVIIPIASVYVGLMFLKRSIHARLGGPVVMAFVGAAIACIVALWVVLFWVQMFTGQVVL